MSGKDFHIVFAERFDESAIERMRSVGRVTVLDRPGEAELLEVIGDCDALLVRTYTEVTRTVIMASSRLKVIGRGGVGLENIDVEAARERGIPVVYTPAAATEAVADLTIGLMIGLLRKIHLNDAAVRADRFQEQRKSSLARELAELTIGIIGMGRIGSAVGRRCKLGFNMRVIYNDVRTIEGFGFTAEPVEKESLYQQADVVSLHVPLTPATNGMINEPTLSRCKSEAILINTARGRVVDSLALAARLSVGKLAGAALDVVEPEPLPTGHPLLSAPHTLFTAHIGAQTHGGQSRMSDVVDDIARVLAGDKPRYLA